MSFNIALGLAFACPITNQVSGSAFDVALPAGCRITGAVLIAHFRSFDWIGRKTAFHSRAPEAFVQDVVARLQAILDPG